MALCCDLSDVLRHNRVGTYADTVDYLSSLLRANNTSSSAPLPLHDFTTSYVKVLGHFYDALALMVKTELHLARIRTRSSAKFLEDLGAFLLPIEQFQEEVGRHLNEVTVEMKLLRS